MSWDAFLGELERWFENHELLGPRTCWIVGVSGGSDSVLLLHAMRRLSELRQLGWKLHVAHLHHGLRGEDADEDHDFVAALARRLNLPHHVERVDIPAEIAAGGGSTEEVARRLRYEFLERTALKVEAAGVAVGHHADDDAETILHRICRGTGIRGLAGMRDRRPIQDGSRIQLIRPFLMRRRAAVEELCRSNDIEYRTDSTNLGDGNTRGRVRNIVMPLLREQLNPNVAESLLRLAEQARWLETYLRDAAARIFDSLVVSDQNDRIILNTRALLSKQRIIQAEVIRRAVALLPGGVLDLSFTNVEDVLRLAEDRASGKELHLPGSVLVRKVYDRLEFRDRDAVEDKTTLTPVFVQCPGVTPLPRIDAELITELCEVDANRIEMLRKSAHPCEQWIDYHRVQEPLMVRGRREGDRFHPLGAPGSKSLSDFFIDEKIEPPLRARTGVLCDQSGVIWVMPMRLDERVKLRPATRLALRLVLKQAPRDAAE